MSGPVSFSSHRVEVLYNYFKAMLFNEYTDAFTKRIVIVPSPLVRSWLEIQMANDPDLSVSMGVQWSLLTSFVDQLPSFMGNPLKIRKPYFFELSLRIEDILKNYGADILRVWASASDYAEDLRIDKNILVQHAESYRKIRNTFRYLLGNLNDKFEENELEKVDVNKLPELEQFILHKIYKLNLDFEKNFKNYNFHNLYKDLLNFCTVDLSAFYFDIRKDTLYCEPKTSDKRKSTLLLLNIILNSLLKWFAPILSFTTEEIYQLISKSKKSIHLQKFINFPKKFHNEKLGERWSKLIKIRDFCNLSIEEKRASKEIGSSLESSLEITLSQELFENFKDVDFAEICITSSAIIKQGSDNEIKVSTTKATGKKCPICWKVSEEGCSRPNCNIQ